MLHHQQHMLSSHLIFPPQRMSLLLVASGKISRRPPCQALLRRKASSRSSVLKITALKFSADYFNKQGKANLLNFFTVTSLLQAKYMAIIMCAIKQPEQWPSFHLCLSIFVFWIRQRHDRPANAVASKITVRIVIDKSTAPLNEK